MRITIVTPTLNRAHFLPEAIESVLRQGHADVEHIIVDGMSVDHTLEVLARYPHVRLIREPDTGLYDALNKGLRAATGEIVGHLNSDDRYTPGAFAQVTAAFADPAVDVVSGGAEILEEGDRVRYRFVRGPEIALTFSHVTEGALNPNARFFRRAFCVRVGLYNLHFRVAADREWMFRALLAQPRAVVVEAVLYQYRWHAESLTFSGDPTREARWREEYLRLAEDYLSRSSLPTEARAAAGRWHLRESAQAATRTLLAGDLRGTLGAARRGLRHHGLWPVMFLRHLAGALLSR